MVMCAVTLTSGLLKTAAIMAAVAPLFFEIQRYRDEKKHQ